MRTLRTATPAAALLIGIALSWPVAAAADPAPDETTAPAPSTGPPPPSRVGSVLAQTGQPASGPFGLPDLSAHGLELLLGQNSTPAAPGTDTAVAAPDLRAFDNQYLLPQNITPAAPGQGALGPGIGSEDPNASNGRLALLRRLHAMYQAGDLEGALLGQRPAEQLDEPLPGTAPAPGSYPPPALERNTADPSPLPPPPPG